MPAGAAIFAPAAAPDAAFARQLAEGELVILAVRPSLWFVFLKRAGWLGLLAAVWLALAAVDAMGWHAVALYPLALVFILAAVAVLGWQMVDRLNRLYVLTDKRVMRTAGVFSRTTVEIPLHMVTTVVLYRTLLDRVLNVGSLLFTSAAASGGGGGGAGGGELVWFIVAQPVGVVKIVRDTLSRYGGGVGGGGGGGGSGVGGGGGGGGFAGPSAAFGAAT